MRRELTVGLLLATITVAVYWPATAHRFVTLDDPDYVSANPVVQAGPNAASLRWALTTGHAANWHPLTWLSHMLDAGLYGSDPRGHHLTSVLWHAAAAVLLFVALLRMTGALWRSALVAALFAWHPLHVESVAWIAERKDVLSGALWMLALLAYAWYAERPNRRRYLLVLAPFALGLLAKPMVVTLPFVLLLLDVWPLGRRASRSWLGLVAEKIPFLLMSAAAAVVTLAVQQASGATAAMERLGLSERLANALVAYARYLAKTAWPAGLSVYYPHPGSWPPGAVLGSGVLLAGLTAAVVVLGRSRRYLIVGWLWYVGTLVPVIGLVQVGSQSMADRYTYLPLIGPFVIVAWLLAEWVGDRPSRRAWTSGVVALVLIGCLLGTAVQLRVWRDSVSLFEHALSVTPNNIAAHVNLGHARLERDELDAAAAQYEAALRLNRALPDALSALALARSRQGRVAEAVAHYEEALRLAPGRLEPLNNLGLLLAQTGRLAEAADRFAEAARSDPRSTAALLNLSRVEAARGERPRAIEAAERALEIAAGSGQRELAQRIRVHLADLRRDAPER